MADRNFQKKKRNDVKRKRKPVMLITAEGRNKTEKQYFGSFQDQHSSAYLGKGCSSIKIPTTVLLRMTECKPRFVHSFDEE